MGIDVGSVVREFGRFAASMDWSAVASVVSAVVAIVAARIARQNAKDAKASAAATWWAQSSHPCSAAELLTCQSELDAHRCRGSSGLHPGSLRLRA